MAIDREEYSKTVKKAGEMIRLIQNTDKVFLLLQSLPKTEIHIHAEAVVSFETILFLNKKYKIAPEIDSLDKMKEFYKIDNLSKMIDFFIFFQTCFKKEEDLKLITKDLSGYMKRNNIYYMELFFSPSGFLKNGLDFDKMIQIMEKAFDDIYQKNNRVIKIIIDVSRTFGVANAEANLAYTLNYIKKYKRTTRIIGIGLGGSEMNGPAADYKKIFKIARENKLKTVAHAGEEVGPESVWSAINDLGALRIGHGTSAIEDEKLMAFLKNNRIPLEICPTSNVITGKYVKKIKNHPLKEFYKRGLTITINTDDPVLFNVELTDELMNLYLYLGFGLSDILEVIKNNLHATFLSASKKKEYWDKFKTESIKIIKKIVLKNTVNKKSINGTMADKKELPLNHSFSH